jgi:UDP-N-acetylglucosamine acyltransferase
MSSRIHPTAVIGKNVEIGDDVEIGPYTVIKDNVSIGARTIIESHVTLHSFLTLGEGNHVFPHADLGALPQDIHFKDVETRLEIGNGNTIREFVSIHRSKFAGQKTVIGNDNFIMGYAHIAHDCRLGNNVILANYAALSGHVEVEDRAFLSGFTGVHQFVRIGTMSLTGGVAKIAQDILPYTMVDGNPPGLYGLNRIGLKRNGVPPEVRDAMKQTVRIVMKVGNRQKIIEALSVLEIARLPEIAHFIEFMKNSKRGFVMKRRGAPEETFDDQDE